MDDELSSLKLFIEKQEHWLHSVLQTLGWSKESLEQGQPCLMQCPHNDHHFIAKSSVEKHKSKCRYGAVGVVTDEEIVSEKGTSKSTSVSINSSIVQAVKKYAATNGERGAESVQSVQQRRDFIDQSELVVESHDARISSLESQTATPPDLLAQGPLHIVRYIKAWPLVPADFVRISSGSLNPVEVKAWLFTNLPDKHQYSSQLGGEITATETIIQTLTTQPSLSPDSLIHQLSPLLGQQSRSFVMRLWKFLHTVSLQRQHTILDSVVAELTPLPQSSVTFLSDKDTTSDSEVESFAGKIQAMAAEDECPGSPLPPLPMECMSHILNPQERRLLYDYVVEVGGTVAGSRSKDPSLYRDDAAAIKAKLKQQAKEESEKAGVGEGGRGERVSLHQMKRERDYRRRRQKYRARNVHITRRTPAQVMRDIINARMLEIVGAASMAIDDDTTTEKQHESQLSEGRDLDQPKLIIETRTEQPLEREQEERHGSRLSHRHYSDREPRSKEGSSGESKRKEKWRRDSRRSRSRERDKSRSRKKSRSRSTSRGRRSSGGHPDQSRERHRHKKKKSRDREREKRGSRTESES